MALWRFRHRTIPLMLDDVNKSLPTVHDIVDISAISTQVMSRCIEKCAEIAEMS